VDKLGETASLAFSLGFSPNAERARARLSGIDFSVVGSLGGLLASDLGF